MSPDTFMTRAGARRHVANDLDPVPSALGAAVARNLQNEILSAVADVVHVLDLDGRIMTANVLGHGTGRRPGEAAGAVWIDTWCAEDRPKLAEIFESARAGERVCATASRTDAGGTVAPWQVTLYPVRSTTGTVEKVAALAHRTAPAGPSDAAMHKAQLDPLTSLPNRALFRQRLDAAMHMAAQSEGRVGLLHLDVDHFKQINDTLGHDAGDAVLRAFAARLQSAIRATDTLARLGGDEFVIVIADLACHQTMTGVIESILSRLREPLVYDGRVIDCRATVGASIYPDHATTGDDLIKNADVALQMAKRAGRGGYLIYHSELRSSQQTRLSMLALAGRALREDRIVVHYQPKFELSSGALLGLEALLRWKHSRFGLMGPNTIQAAFEDFETARAVRNCVMSHVLRKIRTWLDRGMAFGHVSINVAAAEFARNDFAESLLQALQTQNIPPETIVVEVTEATLLSRGADYVTRALALLRMEGVGVALDNFGIGYASLRHIKQFPIDELKIDRSLVSQLDGHTSDTALLKAVIVFAQGLGIRSVATGVERHTEVEALTELGCAAAQGRTLGDVMPALAVEEMLMQRAPSSPMGC